MMLLAGPNGRHVQGLIGGQVQAGAAEHLAEAVRGGAEYVIAVTAGDLGDDRLLRRPGGQRRQTLRLDKARHALAGQHADRVAACQERPAQGQHREQVARGRDCGENDANAHAKYLLPDRRLWADGQCAPSAPAYTFAIVSWRLTDPVRSTRVL
jgi:hypothetical protein